MENITIPRGDPNALDEFSNFKSFVDKECAWWFELTPGARAFYYWKARIMSSRIYIPLGFAILLFIFWLAYELHIPAAFALAAVLGGAFIGLIVAWMFNHRQ